MEYKPDEISSLARSTLRLLMCLIGDIPNFFKKITQARADYEQYLDLKSAAYLLAMERYLMSLALYVKEKNGNFIAIYKRLSFRLPYKG